MTKFLPQKRTQLIEARERMGWTGAELARKLNSYKSTVYRIEAGIGHPSLALMQKWVAVLPGASMEMFLAPGAKARASRGPRGGSKVTMAEWLVTDEPAA